jgi:flagellin
MASIINTNIGSLTAQRNLALNQASLSASMQRLSSGLRINSAKDDAAGMAIASRMSSQINGLNQAARNANDGISLAQTAEGGLGSASDLLQRMRDLAVQSANGTNSDADRASLQAEVAQIKDEINRVANSTSFNGIKLLDGSFSAQSFQVGANASNNDRIQVNSIANMKAEALGTGLSGSTSITSGMVNTALSAGDLTLNGVQVGSAAGGSGAGQSAASAWAAAQAINMVGGDSGVTAKATAAIATAMFTTGAVVAAAPTADIAASSFTINGVAVGTIKFGEAFSSTTVPPTAGGPTAAAAQAANVASAINKISAQSGVIASVDDTLKITLVSTNGNNIDIRVTNDTTYSTTTFKTDTGLTAAAASAAATAGMAIAVGSIPAPTGSATDIAKGGMKINGVDLGVVKAGVTKPGQGANVAAAINLISGQTGVTATANAITGALTLTAADGRNIKLEDGAANTVNTITGIDITASPNKTAAGNGVYSGSLILSSSNPNGIVVGGKKDKYAGLYAFEGMTAASQESTNALSTVDVGTASGALAALAVIDNALTAINTARGAMGAFQNRFTSVVNNLQSTSENLTAARSRVQDADFAQETANLSRAQILQQAGTAMVAQANQLPQGVLALLR